MVSAVGRSPRHTRPGQVRDNRRNVLATNYTTTIVYTTHTVYAAPKSKSMGRNYQLRMIWWPSAAAPGSARILGPSRHSKPNIKSLRAQYPLTPTS